MANSNARPHVQALSEIKLGDTASNLQATLSAVQGEFDKLRSTPHFQAIQSTLSALQKACEKFKSANPVLESLANPVLESLANPVLESLRERFATLPVPWPANHERITPNRPPSPREPSSPRPATPPPSPSDTALQAVQKSIDVADQQEALLQLLLQRHQELAEKRQREATLQRKLHAVSQPVRSCRHCQLPLYIHLPDDTLEPCIRSNRFYCGYVAHEMGQKLLVGNLACIKSRNAAKGRRTYAARKAKKHAGNTAPAL